ncbi:MAG: D-alanine--D-alanine ligase [Planctomycetota bacterium]|nr:MAG: D-alanine--D-alanine ligase [Planctomycetota bacterium]
MSLAMAKPAETSTTRALRVTVLAGGPSAERAVSLESGAAVAAALRRQGHTVHQADISPDNLHALDRPADVVFPALHGTFGEDGQLQALLEDRGIPFVGSGSSASRLAMDKIATKQRAMALRIATPAYAVVSHDRVDGELPPGECVLKPPAEGSSVDTYIARTPADRDQIAAGLLERHSSVLVESFVRGSEITIGIFAGRALPAIRIVPKRTFYNYEAKYAADDTEYRFDTGLSDDALQRLAADSLKLFDDLGCRHLARVDWIVDHDETPWLLEINTLPGFTSHSLLPKAAANAGVPFDELVDQLVRLAVKESS